MKKKNQSLKQVIYLVVVSGLGILMIYPLLWMVMSSFKESNTIFTTAGQLIPSKFIFDNYVNGWKGFAKVGFDTFFKNSLFISVTATVGTVLSSSLVAYGFARGRFWGRKALLVAMLLSMMLPAQVLMIPQYLWYQKLGWVGTYYPLIAPYFFAIQGFFVYLMMNFIEGIPNELYEAARIDGCSFYGIYARIILPLITPALITGGIFSFIWRWDDFLSALLYVNDSSKYPVSLALKLFSDPGSSSDYGAMFAMATLSILPIMLIFIFLQKYLVEGISTSGLKG
ncbi:carbohydrate ABC transporter permease [Anaerotalea alkaliphila]|uniref:Carbohydrate ABC transporter permease n=1 Tax=Anaerotalea alkaliphila TaxID=2662126 RepID=A0A7X5HUU3_9FIRM|nr:carbohydrate ABC transporter permease [Anaerotalea alkaliphila]NDL67070.1 carbohydrate ABC transporter permease [Anaerotalea alkaliphila]